MKFRNIGTEIKDNNYLKKIIPVKDWYEVLHGDMTFHQGIGLRV